MPRDALDILLENGSINKATRDEIICNAGGSNGLDLAQSTVRVRLGEMVCPFKPEELEEIAQVLMSAGEEKYASRCLAATDTRFREENRCAFNLLATWRTPTYGNPIVGHELDQKMAVGWLIHIGPQTIARAMLNARQ